MMWQRWDVNTQHRSEDILLLIFLWWSVVWAKLNTQYRSEDILLWWDIVCGHLVGFC